MGQTENLDMPVFLVFGIVGMLLLAIAIIFFFIVYQKRLLTQKSQMLEMESTYQKKLLKSSVEAQEVERKRIASDLHDSAGSMLSATKMYVKQLPTNNKNTAVSNISLIKKESLGLLGDIITNIREITHNLSPQNLEQFGLIAAIEDMTDRINDLNSFEVSFQFNDRRRLPKEQEIILYRIIQELLNNTLKHAQASQAFIQITFEDNRMKLSYRDDGKGFNLDEVKTKSSKSLGLIGIESRVSSLNASLDLKSEIGQGFQAFVELEIT